MSNLLLENQVALVTGASRGIGRAIAECLAEAVCHVAVTSRNGQECEAVAAEIAAKHPVRAIGIQADIAHAESVHELFSRLRIWSSGVLDVLVCNAGYPFRPEIGIRRCTPLLPTSSPYGISMLSVPMLWELSSAPLRPSR